MARRDRELIPTMRTNFVERTAKVTMLIEGLNFDMPESLFEEKFGRFREQRGQCGHFGLAAINGNYKEYADCRR